MKNSSFKLQQSFGERIRYLRKEKGFSQEGFAHKCGVHRTYMGFIERGEQNISLQNIKRIADALELSLSELLEGVS